jgi:hypothetical protein
VCWAGAPGFFRPGPERSGVKKGGGIGYGEKALGKGVGAGGRRQSPEGPARDFGCGGGAGPGLGGA